MTATLKFFIGGQEIAPERVEAWERRSAGRALRKLGVRPIGEGLLALRQQLDERRRELGHEGIRARLRRDLAFTDAVTRFLVRLSRGQRRFSMIEILSPQGSAEGFARWFEDLTRLNREDAMVAALPEHYLIATGSDGRQEVIETNGGSPMPARFFIDYDDLSSLRSQPDPAFPVQVAGVARAPDGTAVGGVRHSFRNEGDGFRARLIVEFPSWIMPGIVSGHRWHLACEFANWIETALSERA